MALLNPLSHAFGLDFGDRTFKLTQFKKRIRGRAPYEMTAWGSVDVPEGVMELGEIKDADKCVSYIERLVKEAKGKLKGRAVVACLPEAKTFIKIIETPLDADEAALKKAVLSEIEQNIPLSRDDIYFDWQILTSNAPKKTEKTEAKAVVPEEKPEPKTETPPADEETAEKPAAAAVPTRRVLISAAPRNLVDSYVSVLERAGLAPISMQIEAIAITRSLMSDDAPDEEASGILDIGATRSSLVIYDQGSVQMSISIPISGIEITKTVSTTLGVSMDDAETLKRECGLDADRCEDKMWKILLPLIDDMSAKIRNALRFYKIGFPAGNKIEEICLCGGGALFREIDNVLSRKLTIKVRRGNALVNVNPRLPKNFSKDAALMYATAIGLGLDAADENEKYRRSF